MDYYLDFNATPSGSNDGTQGSPWATFAEVGANQTLASGDVVHIVNGSVNVSGQFFNNTVDGIIYRGLGKKVTVLNFGTTFPDNSYSASNSHQWEDLTVQGQGSAGLVGRNTTYTGSAIYNRVKFLHDAASPGQTIRSGSTSLHTFNSCEFVVPNTYSNAFVNQAGTAFNRCSFYFGGGALTFKVGAGAFTPLASGIIFAEGGITAAFNGNNVYHNSGVTGISGTGNVDYGTDNPFLAASQGNLETYEGHPAVQSGSVSSLPDLSSYTRVYWVDNTGTGGSHDPNGQYTDPGTDYYTYQEAFTAATSGDAIVIKGQVTAANFNLSSDTAKGVDFYGVDSAELVHTGTVGFIAFGFSSNRTFNFEGIKFTASNGNDSAWLFNNSSNTVTLNFTDCEWNIDGDWKGSFQGFASVLETTLTRCSGVLKTTGSPSNNNSEVIFNNCSLVTNWDSMVVCQFNKSLIKQLVSITFSPSTKDANTIVEGFSDETGEILFLASENGNLDVSENSEAVKDGDGRIPADAVWVQVGSSDAGDGTEGNPYNIDAPTQASFGIEKAEADASVTISKTIIFKDGNQTGNVALNATANYAITYKSETEYGFTFDGEVTIGNSTLQLVTNFSDFVLNKATEAIKDCETGASGKINIINCRWDVDGYGFLTWSASAIDCNIEVFACELVNRRSVGGGGGAFIFNNSTGTTVLNINNSVMHYNGAFVNQFFAGVDVIKNSFITSESTLITTAPDFTDGGGNHYLNISGQADTVPLYLYSANNNFNIAENSPAAA